MAFLGVGLASWVVALSAMDRKHWREGLTTAFAASVGSFFIDTAFASSGGYWSYQSPWLPGLWPNIVLNLSLYPAGAWIFVQRFPQGPWRALAWIFLGDALLLAVEFGFHLLGAIRYHHGWNLGLSALANLLLLLGLIVFHRLLHPTQRAW